LIWLSWRQHRLAALYAAGGVLLVITSVAVMGVETAPFHSTVGHGSPALSEEALQGFWNAVWITLLALPLLTGLFLGAPLIAQDLEARTHRLAWTQGITRQRWVIWKLGPPLLAIALGTAVLAGAIEPAISTQWTGGQQESLGEQWYWFDQSGFALAAYVLFAVALGVLAGALIGRTLLAMVVTGIAYVLTRAAVATFLRPNYMPPITAHPPEPSGAWTLTMGFTSPGQPNTAALLVYQPADRFWTFQLIEAAIFVGLAVVLVAAAVAVVRRRTA
jgi:ABC-type transport system involved in multi-copper enzyme maturation permease subunit